MNNTSQDFIEYASQFVITDITKLAIVVFGILLVVGFIYIYYERKGGE